MPTETPKMQPAELVDASAWFAQHPRVAIALAAFCLWVSVCLILRMWLIHRRASFLKKLLWSVMLFVPLFGWLFYAGCFQVPGYTNNNSASWSSAEGG